LFLAEKQQGRADVPASSSSGQEDAAQRLREAKTNSRKAMKRPGELMQLAKEVDLPVPGLRRT